MSGKTILVAEDEGLLRRLIERVLTKHGYTVVLAQDGEGFATVGKAYHRCCTSRCKYAQMLWIVRVDCDSIHVSKV